MLLIFIKTGIVTASMFHTEQLISICGVFNDTVSSSDYRHIPSYERIINKQCVGKNMEENGYGLI